VFLLNPQGKKIKSIADYPLNIQWLRKGVGGMTGFETALCFSTLNSEIFVIGYPEKYRYEIIDVNGKMLARIEKAESKPKYSSKEKSHHKKLPLPSEKPFYYDIITDSENRIYIQKNNTKLGGPTDDYDKQVDVFSQDGHFLFTSVLPANTVLIKKGFLYSYEIDEDEGGEYIKRYKIENWENLKVSLDL
jgi:hypothetical protein